MAKMTTPIVLSEDGELHVAMSEGDALDVSVIPVSSDKKNLIEKDEEGLLVKSGDLVSAQEGNALMSGLDGKLYLKTNELLSSSEKVLSVSDNKITTNLSLRYNSENSSLDLLGANGALVSHLQLPIVPGLPVVAEILRDITPPGGSLPRGTYLHLRFILADNTTSDAYVNVSDLVDIYTAGNGISIGSNTISVKVDAGKGIVTSPNGVGVALSDLLLQNDKILTASSNRLTSTLNLSADKVNGRLMLTGKNSELISQVAFNDMVSPAALAKPGAGLEVIDGALGVSCAGITPCIKSVIQSLVSAGAGLSYENGKLSVDFSSMPPAQMQSIVYSMVQAGGGLAVDSAGKLYVDFDNMPTGKFDTILETFRKGLKLPKYLTGNTNFYVDKSHANAGNTLIEGRGSANLPFMTIQAAANDIMNNYNVGPYTANIIVSDDIYTEKLTLGDYARSTGQVVIKPANTASGHVNLKPSVNTYFMLGVYCSGGSWSIYYPKFEISHTYGNDSFMPTAPFVSYYMFYAAGGGILQVYAPEVNSSFTGSVNLACRIFVFSSNDGRLSLMPDDTRPAVVTLNHSIGGSGSFEYCLFYGAGSNGVINLGLNRQASAEGKKLKISGEFTDVAKMVEKSSFTVATMSSENIIPVVADGGSVTGRRCKLYTGATCNTGGRGPEFFPGNQDISVDSSKYCWYN